jgi:hypothetical protein
MKIAVVTANLGTFDKESDPVAQSVPADFYKFDDKNFPPRSKAMTLRLQARIPKMFMWQMVPGYDAYIWYDSSLAVESPDMVKWFLEKLGDADAVFLRHPDRKTVHEEAAFIKEKVWKHHYYVAPRYSYELVDEEIAELESDPGYVDNLLIASTAFMCRNNDKVHALMKEWWYHTSRYHIIDQLGLPYAIYKSGCKVNVINDNYLRLEHLKHTRHAHFRYFLKNEDGTRTEDISAHAYMERTGRAEVGNG